MLLISFLCFSEYYHMGRSALGPLKGHLLVPFLWWIQESSAVCIRLSHVLSLFLMPSAQHICNARKITVNQDNWLPSKSSNLLLWLYHLWKLILLFVSGRGWECSVESICGSCTGELRKRQNSCKYVEKCKACNIFLSKCQMIH